MEHFASAGQRLKLRSKGRRSEALLDFQRRADLEYARSLTSLIESEIIPRLLVAHSGGAQGDHGEIVASTAITVEEVRAFAPLSLQVEADELLDYVDRIVARGVSLESILVDLLAPAARRLGEFWEADLCDFVDVTMALWRLQEVVHELSSRVPHDHSVPVGRQRRALFVSLEGDQHSFGTVVIDELFCANGWLTDRMNEASTVALLERVRSEWFDLAGLTITCDCHIAPLPAIVRAIRISSQNPRICVMVGGRVFTGNAELAASVGADGTAPDARLAVRVAGELVDAATQELIRPTAG